jgi:Zn-dependent protease
VTLNPLAHVDWLGTAILPFITSLMGAGFLGWGKPVYTNNAKLRGGLNGLVLVALAGPFSNVIMAVILAIVAVALVHVSPAVSRFAERGVYLSLYLGLFNLLPVPPLDGSKLLLAMRIPMVIYMEISRFGFMLLILAMVYTGIGQWISAASYNAARAIFAVL